LILVADRQAPMRRAVRRLLGESRFEWLEIPGGEGLLERIAEANPALVILEDRLCGQAARPALARLRALGCQAPVILVSTAAAEALPGGPPADCLPALLIDRLEISSRLPEAARTLLPDAAI
jgi:CheY-like chemotaxis protein